MKNLIEIGKTDEEQAEQIKQWAKENGLQIVAGIALGVLAIWGWNYYGGYQHEQSILARGAYLSVASQAENSQALQTLKTQHSDSAYTQQAILVMAKNAVNNKNYQQALNYLSPLMNSSYSPIKHVAKLRSASIHLQIGQYDQALSTLETNTDSTFSSLYDQLLGDVNLAKNDINSAKRYYQLALDKLPNNSTLTEIIQIKLDDLN